jgi:predicted dehydrogenase
MPRLSRRRALKIAAASTFLAAAPMFIPQRAFGANERIVTGHIGLGGQGNSNFNRYYKENAAAACDVDSVRLAAAAKKIQDAGRTPQVHGDYRKLLDQKDIDAVLISTPDHWHALTTINACEAGKDVYCEKPLSLTIVEGRKMVEAARKHERVVQTGSQQRSSKEFRQACELVRNGALGKVTQVLVGIPNANFAGPPVPDSDPPPELNYDMWLGPAPQRPYNKLRVHYNFRFFWDYSGGQMTNFGAHDLDITQWGLGMDDSGPVQIEGTGTFHPEKWYEVTQKCRVNYKYANGVEVILGQGQSDVPGGVTFIGEKGKIHVKRGSIKGTPDELLKFETPSEGVKLEVSPGHHQNWEACIKSRAKPICDVEIGHRSATVCHLGNIAIRLGRTIKWDPAKEQMVGDEDANTWTSRPYRAPWKLG